MARHHNITGVLTQELLESGDNTKIASISLANVHASWGCYVDMYIEKKLTGKFYLIKGYVLHKGVNKTFNSSEISFNNFADEFGLYIKLTAFGSETPAVDVIIR